MAYKFFKATTVLYAVLLAVSSGLMSRPAHGNEEAYEKAIRSTVVVLTGKSQGSGVLVDSEEGLVVTNYHVVEGFHNATVVFPEFRNGRAVSEYESYGHLSGIAAIVVASNKQRDIAILKVCQIPDGIVAIEFGEPTRPGQSIHSVGNPSSSDAMWVYTFGKVRQNYYRKGHYDFGATQMQVLETDAPINPGDSGGPIVDDDGRLVGISQGYYVAGRMYSYGVDITEITWYLKRYKNSVGNNADPQSGHSESDRAENRHAGGFNDLDLFAADRR